MNIWPYITLTLIQSSLLLGMYEFEMGTFEFKDDYNGKQKKYRSAQDMSRKSKQAKTSQEFNDLRLSTMACTYSPRIEQREEIVMSDFKPKIVLTQSCEQEKNNTNELIADEWKKAQEKIKEAKDYLQAKDLTFEQRNHYRAECLIMGLNTLYKYRNVIIEESKLRDHQNKMTKLLLSAQIAFALSYPINSYQSQIDPIEEKLKKLSTKLNIIGPIQINEKHIIESPQITMPIKIQNDLELSESP